MEVVACLRGSSPVRARVQLRKADTFIEERVRALEDEPLSQTTMAWYQGLSLLDLMPRELDWAELVRSRWNKINAFYSSETKRVTVIDRGQDFASDSRSPLLALEFVHVLQDEDGQLKLDATSHDAELAHRAMRDGEASLYTELAWVQGLGWKTSDVDWTRVFNDYRWNAWREAVADPATYQGSGIHFGSAFGMAYLGAAYQRGGAHEVEKAVSAAPESTREILLALSSAEDLQRDAARPLLPEAWTLMHLERAGAFVFEVFRQRQRGADFEAQPRWPDPEETGWTDDSMSVYRDDSGNLRLYWRVRFASVAQAAAAERYLESSAWQVELRDQDVIISAASEGVDTSLVYDEWGPAPDEPTEPVQRFADVPL